MSQTIPCLIPEQNPQIIFKALSFDCPVTSKPLRVYMIDGHLWLAESDLPTDFASAIHEYLPAFMKGWNAAEIINDGKSVTMISYHVVGFLKKLPQPGMRSFAHWLEEFVIPEVSNYLMEIAA